MKEDLSNDMRAAGDEKFNPMLKIVVEICVITSCLLSFVRESLRDAQSVSFSSPGERVVA